MTSKSPQRSKINEEIARLVETATQPDGTIELADVQARLRQWLAGNLDCVDLDTLAARAVRAYDESLRPRVNGTQLSFFEPEALLPVGEGIRVRMRRATQEQFRAWWNIETQEHSVQMVAYAQKSIYASSRLNSWGSRGTLEQVETEVYLWRP